MKLRICEILILDDLDDKKRKIAGKLFFGQIGTSCVLNYQFEIF